MKNSDKGVKYINKPKTLSRKFYFMINDFNWIHRLFKMLNLAIILITIKINLDAGKER